MKKILSVMLIVMLFLTVSVFSQDGSTGNVIALKLSSPSAMMDGKLMQIDENSSVVPYIRNDTTLVPLRFVANSLKAQIEWDAPTKTVTVKKNDITVKIEIGKPYITINEQRSEIPEPALIRNDRTLIPLRAISEAFSYNVFFENDIILISDKDTTFDKTKDADYIEELNTKLYAIPTVGSKDMLVDIMNENLSSNSMNKYGSGMGRATASASGGSSGSAGIAMESAMMDSAAPTAKESSSSDYSATNTQVAGVDEADVVKTDGNYIYYLSNNILFIAKTVGNEQMELVSQTEVSHDSGSATDMYVDKDRLVVLSQGHKAYHMQAEPAQGNVQYRRIAPYYNNQTSKADVYDISDRQNIILVRSVEFDGNLITSRKIDSSLYFITTKYAHIYEEIKPYQLDEIMPTLKDSMISEKALPIDAGCISYFPDYRGNTFLNVVGFDIFDDAQNVNVESYLGSAENAYVSQENMYVTGTQYQKGPMTVIYKYNLNNAKATFQNKGEVPGNILNQFSMDEHNGFFRIATTIYSSANTNNLFILDPELKQIGSIENIAPKERIYSVRFMGDKGYMVTFEKVDPLFVMDLSDPYAPKMLGELKIPGYSDYLHPYDENHLIGFGKDTVELPIKSGSGEALGTQAYYLGMKIAIFDVTDVKNPKEMFVEYIGDRGTESPVLYNHKALLFNKEKNLLAFPVNVSEVSGDKLSSGGYPLSGSPVFQGAYVYHIDLENGFSLQKKITHNEKSQYWSSDVERLLYAYNTLYAVSQNKITAHDMANRFEDTGEIKLR